MANLVIEHGRLTADPELRQTQSGVPVVSFSIAVPRKYKKDETDFFECVAWRKEAEFLCRYFTKGKWVEVIGSLQTHPYKDKEGKNRKAVEIVANEVNFVGDKPKEDGANGAEPSAPPPPPLQVDPFARQGPPSDFADPDDGDDLPF